MKFTIPWNDPKIIYVIVLARQIAYQTTDLFYYKPSMFQYSKYEMEWADEGGRCVRAGRRARIANQAVLPIDRSLLELSGRRASERAAR